MVSTASGSSGATSVSARPAARRTRTGATATETCVECACGSSHSGGPAGDKNGPGDAALPALQRAGGTPRAATRWLSGSGGARTARAAIAAAAQGVCTDTVHALALRKPSEGAAQ